MSIITERVAPKLVLPFSNRNPGRLIPEVTALEIFEPTAGTRTFNTHIYSDVHLSNIFLGLDTYDHSTHFGEHLESNVVPIVKRSDFTQSEDVLILNGDFFDFLESFIWQHERLPYKASGGIASPESNLETFQEIVAINGAVIEGLQNFLKVSEKARIIFVIGNHDNVLTCDSNLRVAIQDLLMPEADDVDKNKKITFVNNVQVSSMQLHVEHGHRIDNFDYSSSGEATWGDWLAYVKVLMVKRIIDRLNTLKSKGANPEVIDKMKNEILKVEFIRDAKMFPIYLRQKASEYVHRYSNEGQLGKDIQEAIMASSSDLPELIKETPFLGRWKNIIPNRVIGGRAFLSTFMAAVNYIYAEQTHKNSIQFEEALRIAKQNHGIRHVVMGHTHIDGRVSEILQIGGEHKRITLHNTGTWIPRKMAKVLNKRVQFDETEYPRGGIRFTTSFTGKDDREVEVLPVSGPKTIYSV